MNNSNQLGLSEKEARSRLLRDGENRLARSKRINPAGIFAGQFKDVLVLVLLAATAVSVLMGEFLDAAAIIVIVILNAVLGFIQEFRAEKTLEALKKLSAPHAQVFRDGKIVQIEAEKLVRGDVVHLEAGGRIPADCRLINSMSFKCDESLLTGESLPVVKNADGVLREDSLCFMGTSVVCGHGFAEVVETGKSTQMGLISGMLSEVTDERTPLQIRLGELGKIIGLICLGVCFCVSILGIVRGYDIFAMLLTGISLAVAAIPEGLPAVVTISLALAVRRIYKQKALVNKLHSVETLGCADVICTDKTGTLTLNKMTVAEVFTLAKNNEYDGQELYKCGVLCNNSIRQKDGTYIGDPTEIALMTAAEKAGVGVDGYERTNEIPFDSTSMFMQVTVKTPSGVKHDYLKGSVEAVLLKCPDLTQSQRSRILAACNEMTGKALRTLAFAHRKNGASNYSFIGIVGMNDPLRPEIKNAVKKCEKAGITVIMLTGDHKNTAAEIAKQAGILKSGKKIVTGAELSKMSDEELASELHNISVYARVSPGDKLRIVRAFKSVGSIVAMTGDGVNDAPAVKEAAIGVSMGIGGTDVTKEAAHLVLLDDNFATLVSAVEQGRTIYNNIRKSMRYMLSSNIGEVLTMLFAMILGLPVVLIPIQILLINLVTDGLPAIALSMEPATDNIMSQPPRKSSASIFEGGMLRLIIMRGLSIGICTLFTFYIVMNNAGLEAGRTAALAALGLSQLIFVFECKDKGRGIFNAQYGNNLYLVLAVLASVAIILTVMMSSALSPVLQTVVLDKKSIFLVMAFAGGLSVIKGIGKLFIFESEEVGGNVR